MRRGWSSSSSNDFSDSPLSLLVDFKFWTFDLQKVKKKTTLLQSFLLVYLLYFFPSLLSVLLVFTFFVFPLGVGHLAPAVAAAAPRIEA